MCVCVLFLRVFLWQRKTGREEGKKEGGKKGRKKRKRDRGGRSRGGEGERTAYILKINEIKGNEFMVQSN